MLAQQTQRKAHRLCNCFLKCISINVVRITACKECESSGPGQNMVTVASICLHCAVIVPVPVQCVLWKKRKPIALHHPAFCHCPWPHGGWLFKASKPNRTEAEATAPLEADGCVTFRVTHTHTPMLDRSCKNKKHSFINQSCWVVYFAALKSNLPANTRMEHGALSDFNLCHLRTDSLCCWRLSSSLSPLVVVQCWNIKWKD